jgi:putative ABC transport system ATP-binding protein
MLDTPIVEIENLSHYAGARSLKKQILFDISLTIQSQEIVILTGPSGSGKTTLLTLMGGLRTVKHGSLKFMGRELRKANQWTLTQARRRIGYVFQAHNLLDFLTARQNVQMALEYWKGMPASESRARAEAMLRAVNLEQHIHKYPSQLSGGQKQRVAIARALVGNPRLILADEPTASLDSKTGREVVELMQQLAREKGCAILLVTHDNRILDVADRIIHLEDGHLVRDEASVMNELAVN